MVSGRGELHLTILIETMRREGYEFQVSRPEVIFKEDADGKKLEPIEQVEIEVSEQYQGTVIELMGQRRGIMRDMAYRDDGSVHLVFHVPTRGLLGFRQTFLTATRGEGLMNALFMGYEPLQGEINHPGLWQSGGLGRWHDHDVWPCTTRRNVVNCLHSPASTFTRVW